MVGPSPDGLVTSCKHHIAGWGVDRFTGRNIDTVERWVVVLSEIRSGPQNQTGDGDTV